MNEQIEDLLYELKPNDISRFSLATAETLWLTLRNIYSREFGGDINITADIFDKAWLLVAGQLKDTTADQLESMARDQIPNLDNFMDIFESAWRTTLASAAQEAATIVWMAISGLAVEPMANALDTMDMERNTLDVLISTQFSEEKGQDVFPEDDYIEQHPLFQQEAARQLESLKALKSGKTDNFRLEYVRLLDLSVLRIPQE